MSQPLREQIAAVRRELESCPPGLVHHVERVLVEALPLARAWDVDPERTELAAWGHDLFRAHPAPEQLRLAREAGLPISAVDEAEPVLLHGPLGAVVLRDRLGVRDDEVLEAVRDHTLGAERMSLLACVILLADKIEAHKRKRAPVMKEIRRLARRDIDAALLCWADWKWVEERTHGWLSHPRHWDAREEWVHAHHQDVLDG